MKIKLFLFFCASVASVLLSVASCATVSGFQSRIEGGGNRPSDRPELNRSPHRLLVLRGRKDAAMEVWLGVQFVTTNDECRSQSMGALLGGAPEVEQAVSDFVRLPPGQTDFSVRFFLDRYLPGHCGWKSIGVEHAEFVPGVNHLPIALSGLAAIRDNGINKQRIDWICQQKKTYATGERLFLSCMLKTPVKFGGPPVSTDGAVIDLDYQLSPAPATEW